MTSDFRPLFTNPHVATIAGNFWPRGIDTVNFPTAKVVYDVEPGVSVVALENQPERARAQIVCLHGLEGSAEAGYILSLSQAALLDDVGVHRLNLRTCGGTEDLCQTMYHSGLTADTWEVLQRLRLRFPEQPLLLVGFSLGGNVALKLAGEYQCESVLSGVCGVSTPIDLATCVRAIDKPKNFLYARRFLDRLKKRVRRKSLRSPELYNPEFLDSINSIWEFDNRYTAPLFGFGTAANYYATQSSRNFLSSIEVPALLIAAKDDPLVPFSVYSENRDICANPHLELLAPEHGGHLGFLSRRAPRFWLDGIILKWIECVSANRRLTEQPVPHLRYVS